MPEGTLNVAIAGAGFGAYCLTPAFQRDPRIRVVALCAPSKTRREEAIRRYGIDSGFASLADALDYRSVDIAAIAVPPKEQAKLAETCLARGVPVLAEKPLSADLLTAQTLARMAERTGVATAVDFLFPELPSWREAKRRFEEGRIGALRHVVVHWLMESHDVRNRLAGWKTDSGAGGGVMSHFGSHTLYYLEWVCGPIARIQATLERPVTRQIDGETLATLSLTFETGVTGTVCLCSAAPFGTGHRVDLYGEDGALALVNDSADHVAFKLFEGRRGEPALHEVHAPEPNDPPASRPDEDPRVGPISRLVRRFVDAVAEGKQMKPDFRDGLRVQVLLEEIKRSATAAADIAQARNTQ